MIIFAILSHFYHIHHKLLQLTGIISISVHFPPYMVHFDQRYTENNERE